MQIKKWIATGLSALMAGATIAGAGLAATQLGNFPGFLATTTATTSALDAFIVVGKDAATADVVGAVDVAARLAELSYTVETVPGVAAAAVDGVEKDTVGLTDLLSTAFPNSGVMKTIHYSGLQDSTFSWRTDTYDFSEQASIANVKMRHAFAVSNVNGTEKMEIESGDVIYQYVFDKVLSGTGSTTTANYTYPVNVKLLGTSFSIVGTDSSGVRVLQGSIGTADATTPVKYGDYSAYATLASDNTWAKIVLQDKAGNTVDTLVINKGDSKTSTATGLDVQVTAVRALTDGTVVGVDLVIGPTGTTDKTYDSTADTTSTGAASDRFPGETAWGIRVANWGTTAGTISKNSRIEVVYQPTEVQYLKAGEKLTFPNNYAELGFEGWNTGKFAKITIEPLGSAMSAYNDSATTQAFANLQGLKISTDVSGSIVGLANNAYTDAYVLFNTSTGVPGNVFIGFYDSPSKKILVNGTIVTAENGTLTTELVGVTLGTDTQIMYPFKLTYGGAGDQDYYLNVTIVGNSTAATRGGLRSVALNKAGSGATIVANYFNYTTPARFILGPTAVSAEALDVNATTETSTANIGAATQDIVDDSGMIVVTPATYSASDKVVVKIPSKDLKVKAYFGKLAAVTAAEQTYNKIAAITSAVAKLDTEVGTAEKAKNLVLIGGPAVNRLTAEAMGKNYPAYGAASGIPENAALIQVFDGAFTTGKVALVVAGWEADNTRLATSVLQNYDKYLKGVTASKVTVTGTTAAPVVTAAT